MNKYPLNLLQAKYIRRDFQNLIGQEFLTKNNVRACISYVVVSPYDEVNKYMFMLDFRNCQDPIKALKGYDGYLFDVMVIGKTLADKSEYVYKDLDLYLTEQNIPLQLDKYINMFA